MKESRATDLRIGNLAKQLGVERFVIRFWEKEFGIASSRTKGGQRFYKKKDFEQFKLIKELLYNQGFTIAGAKKMLEDKKIDIDLPSAHFYTQLTTLKKQLIKLYNIL